MSKQKSVAALCSCKVGFISTPTPHDFRVLHCEGHKNAFLQHARMIGLLKAAEPELLHIWNCGNSYQAAACVRCQIQALLKEIEA